jgi:alpha-glucosidase
VDEHTKDVFGHRKNGVAAREELIVKVYADTTPSSFILYEDDGKTLRYGTDRRPSYTFRTTEITQRQSGNTVVVTINPAVNVNSPFSGAPAKRPNVVKLVVQEAKATSMRLNDQPLVEHASESAFHAADSGWFNAGDNLILAKSEVMNVYGTTKSFSFDLEPVPPLTSVNFVCDQGFTEPGKSIYVVGSIAELGSWDPDRAIKLDPNIYYEYIWNPPEGHNGPGPSAPVWTGVVAGIPPNTKLEWKCIRKREDGTGQVVWEPGDNNVFISTASGYAGRSYGSF